MTKHLLYILLLIACVSCSTTSNLPEDEVLYTGIKSIKVNDKKGTYAESVALTEVESALAYAPNGSFMGSSSVKSPLQIGLWTYNALVNKPRKGLNKWFFNSFATDPVTIKQVNPKVRAKVATNLLQNYGYFQGKVGYTLIEQKNPQKQKISYQVDLCEPYMFDSIKYAFPTLEDSIIHNSYDESYIHQGGQFSVIDLQSERTRIVNELHDNGFYYYSEDYVRFFADSINNPGKVKLLVTPDKDIPSKAKRQWRFGSVSAYIRRGMTQQSNRTSSLQTARRDTVSASNSTARQNLQGGNNTSVSRQRYLQYDDSLVLQGIKVAYQGQRMPIKPRVLFKNFKFWTGRLYNQTNVYKTTSNLNNMNIFSGMKFSFTPTDTTDTCSTLDVRLDLTMDKLIDTELDFSITQKSNSQIGPNLGITFSKRNAFHHGETFSIGLKGSYEWQTQSVQSEDKRIDSYEIGLKASLAYPWIAFPWLNRKIYRYPTSTDFSLDIDNINRSSYYKMVTFGVEAKYGFQTSRSWSHELSPITVSYNKLMRQSFLFSQAVVNNPALYASMRDQFIPAMRYAIIYDNSWNNHLRHTMHFEGSVKEASNMLNTVNAALGFSYAEKNKKLLGTPYSQFLKFQFELKNIFRLTSTTQLATRLQLGMIWNYGNSTAAPFSEMFYVGGANSIRAFAVRSIGPGRFYDHHGIGSYLYQTGDFKLEANVEYRFPIVQNLYGALFVDAGNVWVMKPEKGDGLTEPAWFGTDLCTKDFLKQIALGTGFGFRYDLQFLIVRFDVGIGIHAPYDTVKKSYYNIDKIKDGIGLHFAVGYPF